MWSPLSSRSQPQRHFGIVALHNRRLRIICCRTQHMQLEPQRRILEVRIQPLGDRDEPDAVVLQDPDVATSEPPKRSSFHTGRQSIFLASASAIRRFSAGQRRFCRTTHILAISTICHRWRSAYSQSSPTCSSQRWSALDTLTYAVPSWPQPLP